MATAQEDSRALGLLGATGIGVGAIVGGGILALAGSAFATTGPSAIVAFALNGFIALLTAAVFAEMSSAFPQSGGSYTFAKKVFSVEAAFAVGWVVWFASIVAGVLYAIGFATYGVGVVSNVWTALGATPPVWLLRREAGITLAVGAVVFYSVGMMRRSAGGGQGATVGKVVLFAVLIAGGIWALRGRSVASMRANMSPFFPGGALGLFQAMGYTFIALQGFDLIAAAAGDVRNPARTVPRAIFVSLGIALLIYLPLLFVCATVGVEPGQSITALSAEHRDTILAVAAANYLGPVGFWLVMVAAVLSMLSALHANLFGASRISLAMARDRTLPMWMGRLRTRRGTPVAAILTSAAMVAVLVLLIPDVATAGAAASLIFLVSFALAHWTSILMRLCSPGETSTFRTPLFPLVPVVGGLLCLALAVFQAIAVPAAGAVVGLWLAVGSALYLALFARRARVVDAAAEAHDPQLVRLRGRAPLVLVPVANPANAAAMVAVANALATPRVGRVTLLYVVAPPGEWREGESPPELTNALAVLREALVASFANGLSPQALTTIAPLPWLEIARVARVHHCESLLVGFTSLTAQMMAVHLEELINDVNCDVVVLRAAPGWQLPEARRVLVPVAGRGMHNTLRARLLGSLVRSGPREITYLRVLPEHASQETMARARRDLNVLAEDEVDGQYHPRIARSNSAADEIIRQANDSDLVILGLQRLGRKRKVFGDVTLHIIRNTQSPIIMISGRG